MVQMCFEAIGLALLLATGFAVLHFICLLNDTCAAASGLL